MLVLLIVPTVLLILGSYHGLMQVLYRAGLIRSTGFLGLEYYQGLTLHGVINALVFTTFFEVAFGYVVVAYFLRQQLRRGGDLAGRRADARRHADGRVRHADRQRLGAVHVLPAAQGQPALLHRRDVAGGGIVDSVLPVDPRCISAGGGRTRGARRRSAVVGMLATFTVWFLATLPLAYEVIVQLIPWSLGWTPTVNVVLARTLFWFFGHPLVYFWLLPAYVMFYVMLPAIAGGKLYSDAAGRLAFMLFIVLLGAGGPAPPVRRSRASTAATSGCTAG